MQEAMKCLNDDIVSAGEEYLPKVIHNEVKEDCNPLGKETKVINGSPLNEDEKTIEEVDDINPNVRQDSTVDSKPVHDTNNMPNESDCIKKTGVNKHDQKELKNPHNGDADRNMDQDYEYNQECDENYNENCNENCNENFQDFRQEFNPMFQYNPEYNQSYIEFGHTNQKRIVNDLQMMEICNNNHQLFNSFTNEGINVIDPITYSPMVYVLNENKMVYPNSYPYVYDSCLGIRKNSSLPYAYVSRDSSVKPDFNIAQNKLKLYNYWIETTNPRTVEENIVNMFGIENIYKTKSLFFRKKNSYMGEKVILIDKLPQKPFKFINRINRTFSKEKRTVKSVLGDYIISPDCIFIVLAERSVDYICNNYYRYHKTEKLKIETLLTSFREKFTCVDEDEML